MKGMRKRNLLVGVTFVGVLATLGVAQSMMEKAAAAQGKAAVQAPYFEVDPMWPKPLNKGWLYGNVIGLGVDNKDHVYMIHRGAATLDRKEAYALQNPPMSECCVAAPPVMEFDGATGNFVTGWGGPGQGYEWPESNHGITPDSKGNVWIGGNGGNDGHILKFTQDGKFVKQFGFAYANAGSNDTWAFNKVAKVSLDEKANEAYVSDGYGNKRVAVIDMETGKIKRFWGAYGKKPDDTNMGRYNPDAPLIQQFRNPVHCAEPSNDGFVYVCDRVERPHPGVPEGRQVRQGSSASSRRPSATARCGTSPSRRTPPRSTCIWPTARTKRSTSWTVSRSRSSPASATAAVSPAVLRRAQHRDRLEGQHLHDGDLRRQAHPEVRLQGPSPW